jgi:chromosome partitioning protein
MDTPQNVPGNPPKKGPIVLALCNDKGGCNKTTGCINIAAELASRNFNVLLMDLDQQGDATKSLLEPDRQWTGSTGEVLLGEMPLMNAILPTAIPTLWLLPSDKEMRGLEVQLVKERPYNYAHVLDKILKAEGQQFDFIILDCPGNVGTLTVLALVAADAYLIPCEPEYYSLDAAKSMVQVAENLVEGQVVKEVIFAGLYFSPYNELKQNSKIQKMVIESADETFPGQVFTNVREDSGIRKSQLSHIPLVIADPEARAVKDYRILTDEVFGYIQQQMAVKVAEAASV